MLGQFSYAKVAENMNTVKREMEDVKNNSSLQSLGKSNMATVFLRSGGTSVGECSCTTCYQPSQWIWERSRADLHVELLTCAVLGPGQASRINSEMEGNWMFFQKGHR